MIDDLYALLHVERDADPELIRAAYRSLARAHHPDVGGDPATMAAINEAWHTLGNVERRAAYDERSARERWGRPGLAPIVYAPPRNRRRPSGGGMPGGTSTILDFGRHAGSSIEALAASDPDYLDWLARTPIGRPFVREIAATLARVRAAADPGQPTTRSGRARPLTGWAAR